MKNVAFLALLAALVIVANGPAISLAQQQPDDAPAADSAAPAAEETASTQRLPPGYTDIITNSQRRQIYSIQGNYQGRIDALRSQIAEIEAQRDAEIDQVLDDQQKQVLRFILEIRERNRTEASEAQAAEPPEEATPVAANS